MIYQENFEAQIKGLLGLHIVENASLSYKLLEEESIFIASILEEFRKPNNANIKYI